MALCWEAVNKAGWDTVGLAGAGTQWGWLGAGTQ